MSITIGNETRSIETTIKSESHVKSESEQHNRISRSQVNPYQSKIPSKRGLRHMIYRIIIPRDE